MQTKTFYLLSAICAISAACAEVPLKSMTVGTPVQLKDKATGVGQDGVYFITQNDQGVNSEPFFIPWEKLGDTVVMPRADFKAFAKFCHIQRKGE